MDDSDTTTSAETPTTKQREEPSHLSRRRFLLATGTGSLGLVAGCSNQEDGPVDEGDHITDTQQSESSTLPSGNRDTSQAVSAIKETRAELDLAFTEIQSVGLVDHESQVWMPRYQDLGNMDREKVEKHIANARDELSRASNNELEGGDSEVRIELLEHVATTAQRAADFFYSFALTFEKIYQYEYLVQTRSEYAFAAEKMGEARNELSDWPPLAKELADVVASINDISESNDDITAEIESFELDKWNHVAFGAKEYAHRMEPRILGFKAYAEAYAADLAGVEALDSNEYQTAQNEFVTARETIRHAKSNLEESNKRGSSFFESRSRAFLNRIPLFEEGYVLHLRAANEFDEGNIEEANDLEFEGTTKIRNALALYPVEDGDAQGETSTPS